MSYLIQAENLKHAIEELKATRQRETHLMMIDEVALVKRRVINTGEKSTGGLFEPYSPAYAKLRKKRTFSSFRNFTFNADMMKSISAVELANDEYSTTYILGSEDPQQQKIVNYNKKRSGDFLALSPEEQVLLHKLNRERVIKVLRKHNVI